MEPEMKSSIEKKKNMEMVKKEISLENVCPLCKTDILNHIHLESYIDDDDNSDDYYENVEIVIIKHLENAKFVEKYNTKNYLEDDDDDEYNNNGNNNDDDDNYNKNNNKQKLKDLDISSINKNMNKNKANMNCKNIRIKKKKQLQITTKKPKPISILQKKSSKSKNHKKVHKVTFSKKIKIYCLYEELDDFKNYRQRFWENYYIDRLRFKSRIENVEKILFPILKEKILYSETTLPILTKNLSKINI